jgi:DNA-binding transcriptional LysR family regulator
MHKTTLEQWSLLEKVVEAGSFAKAAEETHRSQSSVSYNLSLLQERLGVALLVPEGRRAVLTPAGELLNQVKPLLKAFSYVETRAATLATECARGWIWWWTPFPAPPPVRHSAPVPAAVSANPGTPHRGAGKHPTMPLTTKPM